MKYKTILTRTSLVIRQSDLLKPLRNTIKSYRRNNWKKQLEAMT